MDTETMQMLKALAWNDAKGKLQALIDMQLITPNQSTNRYKQLNEKVEKFINEVENEGLCE